jgi:hypothetical protein
VQSQRLTIVVVAVQTVIVTKAATATAVHKVATVVAPTQTVLAGSMGPLAQPRSLGTNQLPTTTNASDLRHWRQYAPSDCQGSR